MQNSSFSPTNDLHPTKPRWFAMYTKSRQEKKVHEKLQQLNIESYLPLRTEIHQWSDRKKRVQVPLFTSYVFAKVIASQYYHIPKEVPGFIAFVTLRGSRVAIRDEEISAIKLMLAESELSLETCTTKLQLGRLVEVLDGPMMGMRGHLIEIKGKNKVAVQFQSLDMALAVEINPKRLLLVHI